MSSKASPFHFVLMGRKKKEKRKIREVYPLTMELAASQKREKE